MKARLLAGCTLVVVALFAFAMPAWAASNRPPPRSDRRISVTGGVVVDQGETVKGPVVSIDGPAFIDGTVTGDVLVGKGSLEIRGRVTGDVLVVRGNAVITGRVGGDVIVLDGRITTRDGARVNGDVKSRRAPTVAPGTVRGAVKTLNVSNALSGFLVGFLIYLWIAVTLSVAVLGLLFVLLFPRAADATANEGRRFWPTLGWGALIGVVAPVVAVLVLVTIVGIPFGLGILSALNVLAPLGYVASSLILGRLMVKGTSTGARIGAFFAGFGILRAVALIPAIGFLGWFLACLYGLGALARAAWRAGHGAAPASQQVPATGTVPPPEQPAPMAG